MPATRDDDADGASSSFTSPCRCDVLLSFRCPDTGNNFTDYLFTALRQAGIHTFKAAAADNTKIRDEEIQRALRASKLSIIVFSKDYASSTFCLDLLLSIMNRRKTNAHLVIPVFYHVDPSLVSDQIENYADVFSVYEIIFKEEMERVNEWRASLTQVASLGGMVLQEYGYEAQFVQDIVKVVSDKLNRGVLHVPLHFVGGDFLVKDVNLWLQSRLNDDELAVLHGLGGVGKTTIAKIVYNQSFGSFEARSFLADVRERLEQPNGLNHLQEQLLSDILNSDVDKLQYATMGITNLEDALRSRKVLVVLDNVEKKDQLNELIWIRNWLCPGSKMIVTTRNESILPVHEACVKFKVEPLDNFNSLQLFIWHAFGQARPSEDHAECSKTVVDYCGGLPLALTIIGSSLSGKKARVWQSALQELQSIPNGEIQKILRISYDSLDNDNHKKMFLDIACFFIGMDKDYVLKILSGLGVDANFGFQNLIDGCLIEINRNNRLLMHQLIRDMGREIARQELHKCGRIWRDREAFSLLRENNGTKTAHGLTLDMHSLTDDSQAGHFHLVDAKAFSKMYDLKYLKLNYAQLDGNYYHFPKGLIWLCWHGVPLKSMPKQLCLEKLVVLDMQNSSLVDAWTGNLVLPRLKILDLSNSRWLIKTPNFSSIPRLERLILADCVRLVEIHQSIGNLKQLVLINLKNCRSVKKLPEEIEMLVSLKHLVLCGCSNLEGLPQDLGQQNQWKLFQKDGLVAIKSHIISTAWVSCICSCFLPSSSPELTTFLLPHFLVTLNLSRTQIQCLPESIKSLNTLTCLSLDSCESLKSLPELPTGLKVLGVSGCSVLQKVANLPPFLFLYHCHCLDEVQDLIKQELVGFDLNTLRIMKMICLEIKPGIFEVAIESGIFSVYLPGQVFPSLSEDEDKLFLAHAEQPELTFSMPSPPTGYRICGLNLWTVCCIPPEFMNNLATYARINNQTKGSMIGCCPLSNFPVSAPGYLYASTRMKNMELLWFSHWRIGNHQIDSGDEVNVCVHPRPNIQTKRIGVQLVYEKEEEGEKEESDTKSINEEILLSEEVNDSQSIATWIFNKYTCFMRMMSVNHYYSCLFIDKERSRKCFRRFIEQKGMKGGDK